MSITLYEQPKGKCLHCGHIGRINTLQINGISGGSIISLCDQCKGMVSNLLTKDTEEKDIKELLINMGMDYMAASLSAYGFIPTDKLLEDTSIEAVKLMTKHIDDAVRDIVNKMRGGLQ